MPSSIETGLGAKGAACAEAEKARLTADARINPRISVSIGETKRPIFREGG
jgi:hypothetical protein